MRAMLLVLAGALGLLAGQESWAQGDEDGAIGWEEYLGGTDPTNSPDVFLVNLTDVQVDWATRTVAVALSFTATPMHFYALVAAEGQCTQHQGTAWTVVGTTETPGSLMTFTDTWSGPLNLNGRTYAGIVSLSPLALGSSIGTGPGSLFTVNLVYLPYPFLSPTQTVLRVEEASSASAVGFSYHAGSHYSVSLGETNLAGRANGFFRLRSTDADPTNAWIEALTL